jgi:2-dehydropantoate 2-reductase
MSLRIAQLGTGAIGSNMGALLTRAGYDVTLIDGWAAHVDVMKTEGLKIVQREETFEIDVEAIHVGEVCALKHKFDVVFLTCKSYDSVWMAELIKPYIAVDGFLVSVQNSINEDWLIPVLGQDKVVGSALTFAAEIWKPGQAQRFSGIHLAAFTVGEPSGPVSPRVERVREILSHAGVATVTDDLVGTRWSKLLLNAMEQGIGALTGYSPGEIYSNKDCIPVWKALGTEAYHVAMEHVDQLQPIFGLDAADFQSEPDAFAEKLMSNLAHEVDSRGTMWCDIVKGRRSEGELINGLIARRGAEKGIEAPANVCMAKLLRRLEIGELKPEPANITLMHEAASVRA